MTTWYALDDYEVLRRLSSDPSHGLDENEAALRLERYGANQLLERGIKSPWRIFWEQLKALMVVILIIAAVISAALGDYQDAIAIAAIVAVNAILGFIQEYRAERAMAALKKLAVPTVTVRRGGHLREVPAHSLVPGDIFLLEAGNLTPADGRILTSANLRVQEAPLTGESEPVDKVVQTLNADALPLGDRRNMVYMGTLISYGRGEAVVTETGMATELGRIAAMIQSVSQEPTPLQRRLDRLGRQLAAVALALVGLIFTLGLLRGESAQLMFLTAVSIAVAAVPEGLPAVVTIALALGAQRMLKRKALIRKLSAVETLGSVTVICSDKTGTLTENRMTVAVLEVADHQLDLNEYRERTSSPGGVAGDPVINPAFALLLTGGALCNDARLMDNRNSTEQDVQGDPTEAALVLAAARGGYRQWELNQAFPRLTELPFDSERKRMTTVHSLPASWDEMPAALRSTMDKATGCNASCCIAFTKGAVDGLLDVSTRVWVNHGSEPLSSEWRRKILSANDRLARGGMRVLGVAYRALPSLAAAERGELLERQLVFLGLVGMIDPPRTDVRDAILTCRTAGIRPVMITGDHPLTAQAIGRQLGIGSDGRSVSGPDLTGLSPEELETIVDKTAVYARVSPEHKLKIVQALQNRGHIVAMTGDGVNDAPALKKADIGVAMGITGTDVSKEAADMVLLDDNFTTIVAAVEQGRVIYDNIRKFIKYLMTTNSAEIWVMLLAPFLGMPLPLLPLQILWVNLVTDGLPALALGMEPAERNTMRRVPYHPNESVFSRGMGPHIIWVGLLMSFISLAVGYGYWFGDQSSWQTMVFTTLTVSQLAHVMAIRSGVDSLFSIGLWSNKPLVAAVGSTLGMQLAVVYLPFLQELFRTVALPPLDLALALALGSIVFWAVELEKWLVRRTTG